MGMVSGAISKSRAASPAPAKAKTNMVNAEDKENATSENLVKVETANLETEDKRTVATVLETGTATAPAGRLAVVMVTLRSQCAHRTSAVLVAMVAIALAMYASATFVMVMGPWNYAVESLRMPSVKVMAILLASSILTIMALSGMRLFIQSGMH